MKLSRATVLGIVGGGPTGTLLPKNLLTATGTEFEGFNTFADWTQDAGTIGADTTNFRTGAASLKLTCASGASASASKTISKLFGTAPMLRLTFYLAETIADCSNIQIRFSSVSNFAKTKYCSIGRSAGFHTGWNTIDIYSSDWQDIGSEDWANTMTKMRVTAIAMSGKTCNVSVDSMLTGVVGYPCVMLNFDDCLTSLYATVYPYLKARNMRASAFCISDNIGTAGYVTQAQLQEIAADGNIMIGNHTKAHPYLTSLSEGDQETQIGTCKTYLEGLGITTGKHLAQPYGDWNEDTLTACRNLGIASGRTVQSVAYPVANDDQMLLISSYPVINTDSLTTIKGWVDKAITYNTPINLQFHDIVEVPSTTYQWATADFKALIHYIAGFNLPMITHDDFYRTNSTAWRVEKYADVADPPGPVVQQNLASVGNDYDAYGRPTTLPSKYYAASFTANADYSLTGVDIALKIGGGTGPASVVHCYIYADSGSHTPTTSLAEANITRNDTLTSSYVYYNWTFDGLALTNGTKYWVVLMSDTLSNSNFGYVSQRTSIAGEYIYVSPDGTTWTTRETNEQATMRLYKTA
jgi:peptidoglycan/xylan/chitin deacetylase (PgdA/CDA1 family)